MILSQCAVFLNDNATNSFSKALSTGRHGDFIKYVLSSIVDSCEKKPLSERIDDHFEKFVAWVVNGKDDHQFAVMFTYRRMGIDNGMDTIVHLDNNLKLALQHITNVTFRAKSK